MVCWVQSVRVSLDAAPEQVDREQQEQRQQDFHKGKIISTKVPVLCPKVLWRGGDPVVTFTASRQCVQGEDSQERDVQGAS